MTAKTADALANANKMSKNLYGSAMDDAESIMTTLAAVLKVAAKEDSAFGAVEIFYEAYTEGSSLNWALDRIANRIANLYAAEREAESLGIGTIGRPYMQAHLRVMDAVCEIFGFTSYNDEGGIGPRVERAYRALLEKSKK